MQARQPAGSGTVRVRCLAQGHLDTGTIELATWRTPARPALTFPELLPLRLDGAGKEVQDGFEGL